MNIDKETERILRHDSLGESEKILGNKHWSQFDKSEQTFSFLKFVNDNEIKKKYLQSVGDTYWGIKWNEFIKLIKNYGFKEGLRYDFVAPKYYEEEKDRVEEAIIYYNLEKGLILWSTSYGSKDHINEGKVYGMAKYKEWNWEIFMGCSHGDNGEDKNIRYFDYDIREGFVHNLNKLDSNTELLPVWQGRKPFLWFVDYAESKQKEYDYNEIAERKIKMCPKELQNIINGCQ